MKKLLILGSFAAMVTACKHSSGELVGTPGRNWFQPDPFGMNYIHPGGFNMGPSDEDITFSHTTKSKTVSVQAFYIDDSEISNNEYRQFVYWVRDSIARRKLIEDGVGVFGITKDQYDQDIDPAQINWDEPIDYTDQQVRDALNELYLPENERFFKRHEVDTRKLNYEYYIVDVRTAAAKSNRFQPNKSPDKNGQEFINGGTIARDQLGTYNVTKQVHKGDGFYEGVTKKGVDRSVFILKDIVNVYPDTLAWVHDFTYSFNEPMTNTYFWHPAYDDYPVVGVTWKQARAFNVWRTQLLSSFYTHNGQTLVNDFRLPTEAEWEWAARGDLALSPYPWGGPYIRNARGCFLGNFKPMRGLYFDDGGFQTVPIYSYNPNDFGLYCMAGNVAEWTNNAFDESAFDFTHDMNPNYEYEAQDNEPAVLKRKVIRGGSWKDIGYYLQCGARTYEYQDTAKCYIGFRCVMTYLGRAKGSDGRAEKIFSTGK